MKTKSLCLLGFFALVLASGLAADNPAKSVPETSTVVFENEKVRVILFNTNGGRNVCGLGVHSHPAHLYIMLTPGKLRITTPDGKEEVADSPAVTHLAECVTGLSPRCSSFLFDDVGGVPSPRGDSFRESRPELELDSMRGEGTPPTF